MAYGNHRSCASCGSTGKAALITPKLFYNFTKGHKICSTSPTFQIRHPVFTYTTNLLIPPRSGGSLVAKSPTYSKRKPNSFCRNRVGARAQG